MTKFKPLPPGLASRLIQGIPDILAPLAEQRMARIKTPCPRCGAAMAPHLYARQTFTEHDPLPRTMARCPECGAMVDPVTQIVLDTGDPRKIDEALPIIRGKTDD
jgi:ribosomal protein S27AE